MTTDKTPATLATVKHGGCVQLGTPRSRWAASGEPDPHGTRYDCERAALVMGDLTDDELANAVFMHGNERQTMADLVGGATPAIAYLTAAKDRIRWLSRALAAAESLSAQPSQGGQGDAREQFEEYRGGDCERDAQGYYVNARTAQDWAMWQAALAARQPMGQITDAEIDARLNALYREITCSGQHNGGMSGVAWDRAVYRMAASQPAQVGAVPCIDYEDLVDQAKDLIHCGCSVNGAFDWLLEQLTDGEALAAPPAQAVDLSSVRALLQRRIEQWRSHLPADPDAPGTREIETKGERDYNNDVRIYREGIAVMQEVLSLTARHPAAPPAQAVSADGFWLAVDDDGFVHFGQSTDDGNGGVGVRENVESRINDWLDNDGRSVDLVWAGSAPAQAVDLAEFKALYRAYVRLLESGRDRIIDLGGTCDPVDVMEANDVDLQAARRFLDSQAVGK